MIYFCNIFETKIAAKMLRFLNFFPISGKFLAKICFLSYKSPLRESHKMINTIIITNAILETTSMINNITYIITHVAKKVPIAPAKDTKKE